MIERLVYVVWITLTAGSLGTVGLTPLMEWPEQGLPALLWGSVGVIASHALNLYGRSHLHFTEHEASLDQVGASASIGSPEHQERALTLRRLFQEWDELDDQRSRGGGDVWQIHALRREARSLLSADPLLRTEFDREVARHPELIDR